MKKEYVEWITLIIQLISVILILSSIEYTISGCTSNSGYGTIDSIRLMLGIFLLIVSQLVRLINII